MHCLSTFENIIKKYSNKIDGIHIYIDEAHPKDGWFIGSEQGPEIYNHTHISHRKIAAEKYINNSIPVYLDDMNNNVKYYFGVQYERLYILHLGKVIYKGKPGPFGYNLAELENAIQIL